MSKSKPTYQELEKRLAAAESILKVLRNHEVDAVMGEEKIAVLLLREVEKTLRLSDAAFRAMFELPGVGMVAILPLSASRESTRVLRHCRVSSGRIAGPDVHRP